MNFPATTPRALAGRLTQHEVVAPEPVRALHDLASSFRGVLPKRGRYVRRNRDAYAKRHNDRRKNPFDGRAT